MRTRNFLNTGSLLLPLCLAASLQAGEWELGGAFAFASPSKGSIGTSAVSQPMPYTNVQNSFNEVWIIQGGLQVGYEVLHRGPWSLWLQAQYSAGLNQPQIYHSGENYAVGSTITESYRGACRSRSMFLGFSAVRRFSFGEFGLSAGPRSSDWSTEGQRQNQVNGVFTFDQYSVSHSYRDTFVALSFALTQAQEGFRSFQKISFGTGFGSSVPAVNPGPGDWRMNEAYLAQFRPNQEIRITLGVRL